MNNRTFDDYSYEVLTRSVKLAQDLGEAAHDSIDKLTELLCYIAELIEADNE